MSHCGKEIQNKGILIIGKRFESLFQYSGDSSLTSMLF